MSEDIPADLVPSQRRLQRAPDFTGGTLASFSPVFLRHGLPGLMIGIVCLAHPQMRELALRGLEPLLAEPILYAGVALFIGGALVAYAWYLDRRIGAAQLGWILYLGALSAWEEWVFRLALPYFATGEGVEPRVAVVTSNLAFGLMHYFTLRWKWQWCLGAFLGGLALSRQLHSHFDLALIVAIHWAATFLNTPRLPGRSRSGSPD